MRGQNNASLRTITLMATPPGSMAATAAAMHAARASNSLHAIQPTPPTAAAPSTAPKTLAQITGGSSPPIQNSGARTRG